MMRSEKLTSTNVLDKMLFVDPSLEGLPIKCWVGNMDKGEGDTCSNLPFFLSKSRFYRSVRHFSYWLKVFIPKCRISVKHGFLNIYWDKGVLLEVLQEINEGQVK